MVYGFRFIGNVYYSEWGFDSLEKTKSKLEEITRIFGKGERFDIEIFEKRENKMETLTKTSYNNLNTRQKG